MSDQTKTIIRTLSLGLAAWLQYERCCRRTEVLSEAYLSYPISQILNSHSNARVVSEFVHPVLKRERDITGGRKPALDFALCDHDGTVKLAIEVKWAGRSELSLQSVIWDLVRLELLRRESEADCIFILAGQMGRIENFFSKTLYAGKYGGAETRKVLNHLGNGLNSLSLDSTIRSHRPIFKELYKNYQGTQFPNRLATNRTDPLIETRKARDYQVYVWRLAKVADKSCFRPQNIPDFKVSSELPMIAQ